MNFWRKGGSHSQPQHLSSSSKRRGIGVHTNSLSSNGIAAPNRPQSMIRPSPSVPSPTMPSRRQRMQLLKSIIHHADKVQNEYLVNNAAAPNNAHKPIMNSILVRRDADVAEINEKCFKRWHQVLQEGLVPLSVVALNLLKKGDEAVCDDDEEEEAYFASLEGMEEEIQVMAILARAAALSDDTGGANVDSESGIEQINAVMKCIAMLLFHIVLDASSTGTEMTKTNIADSSKSKSSESRKSVAGYDGRIRHVVKSASVDVLSRTILECVNKFSPEEVHSSSATCNIDDFSSWDISNLKAFLDKADLGKGAIFGTVFKFKPSAESVLEGGNTSDDEKELHSQKQEESTQNLSGSNEQLPTSDGVPLINESNFVNYSSSLTSQGQEDDDDKRCNKNTQEKDDGNKQEPCPSDGKHNFDDTDPQVRRLFNAKFLATRKYEIIERLVAIEIVRFFLAEERELKIRRQNKPNKPVSLSSDNVTDHNSCPDKEKDTNSQLFSTQQIKRGVKIAGAGIALGTVFAITGGLAAPALAAALGGVTALTGATTATSTALLALLATFKAGAALFGVGGGGLAAYKMNRRTAGLSDFVIRRENIDQYMYLGAPDEKMKKGIEAMLPQLHTTVAVSGWLRDKDVADFQLAWGVQPTCNYEKTDEDTIRIRKMKRFYSIYNPPLVNSCEAFMQILQSKLKRNFSWDRQMENKYGANPDHMIPLSSSTVYLSPGEKAVIAGVLNDVKVANLKKRGLLGVGCNDNDEIDNLLAEISPTKKTRKNLDLGPIETEFDVKSGLDINESDDQTDMKIDRVAATTGAGTVSSYDVNATASPSEQNDVAFPYYRRASSYDIHSQKPGRDEDNETLEHDGESRPVVWDWTQLYGTADIHTVTWESKMLRSLCHIVEKMAFEISGQATRVALQFSVIGAVLSAIMIPSALATATKFIDDPYQIVVIRADAAGKELAKCLLQSDERRPVTLVGFSFGARVIYSCLRELARQQDIWEESRTFKSSIVAGETTGIQSSLLSDNGDDEHQFMYDREPASLVADVVFIGLPRAIDEHVLTSCRRVTGGRFVHCYTRNDWFLTLMFIARAGTPCGIKPITNVPGVENYDVTEFVEAHTKYADAIPRILQHIRFAEP